MLLEITSTFAGKAAFITANCFSLVCHMWIVTLYKLWFIGSFFQKHGLTLSGKRRNPCPQNANPDANCCLASIFQNLPQGGHLCQMRPQGDRRGKEGQQLSLLVVQWLPIQDTCEARNSAEQQQHESLSKQKTDEEGLMADYTSQYTATDYNYVVWMDVLSQAPKSWV